MLCLYFLINKVDLFLDIYRHNFYVKYKNNYNIFCLHFFFFILIRCIKHAMVISQILFRCVRATALSSFFLWFTFLKYTFSNVNRYLHISLTLRNFLGDALEPYFARLSFYMDINYNQITLTLNMITILIKLY